LKKAIITGIIGQNGAFFADACYYLLQNYNVQGLVNVGCGTDVSIKELAELIVSEVEYEGKLVFDTSKPDGTPRKLMDTSKINNLRWISKIKLTEGIKKTVLEYLKIVD